MGCAASTPVPQSAVTAAAPVSEKRESPTEAVQRTWELVAKDIDGAGTQLFKEIFAIAPGAIQLFSFKDEPDVYKSAKFLTHARGVMTAVGKAVSSLEDLTTLVPILKDLGAKHVAYGVKDAHYDVVGQALLATLKKGLGGEWNESVKSAWADVYDTIASTMKAGAAEAPAPPPASPQLPAIRAASPALPATRPPSSMAKPTPEKVAAQAATLQSSWGMFVAKSAGWGSGQKHFDGAAVALFQEIFTLAPEAVGLFSFKDVEDMYNSQEFLKHGRGVVQTIGTAVAGLGNIPDLVPVLTDLGRKHAQYGVEDSHYDVVGQALLTVISRTLESNWTPKVQAAWEDAYCLIASTMKVGAASIPKDTPNGGDGVLYDEDYNEKYNPADYKAKAAHWHTMDPKDAKTPDEWVNRHPSMIRLTGRHPFNSEAPLPELLSHGFISPQNLQIVRNHGAVPQLKWETHKIAVKGNVSKLLNLSMDEIASMKSITFPCLVTCAGNRRKEQNMIKKTIGFSWGPSAVGVTMWTGVPLREILKKAGVTKPGPGRRFVCFAGPEGELPRSYDNQQGGPGSYGTSIDIETALDPTCDVIVAYMQNGERLHPDHGFPARVLLPGHIGGRMVKWLHSIEVMDEESNNYFHFNDNRVLPSHVDAEKATEEGWWFKPEFIINQLNINGAIGYPWHKDTVPISQNTLKLSGYAYSGGGRRVIRTEISLDQGQTWHLGNIVEREKPRWAADSSNDRAKHWCWCFWEHTIDVKDLDGCPEICFRAWDQSQNSMPERPTWNVMGMLNNPWYRVRVHKEGESYSFEHPTLAGTDREEGWMVKMANEAEDGELRWGWGGKGGPAAPPVAAASKPEETPVEAVKRTWALVAQDIDGAGVALFKEIFAIAPGAVDLFSFKDEPDMYNSDKLKTHARGVMKAVGMAVAGLDDVEKLVPVLKELGAKHVAYGVVDAHYDVVGQALLTTLEKGLGAEQWTEAVKAAWTDVYGTVASTMKAGAAEQE